MTFHYFAYGSNMLPSRLLDRCPSAKPIGVALAANVGLEFSKMSKDGSGKATLAPLVGSTVPGVIFTIDTAERAALTSTRALASDIGATMHFLCGLSIRARSSKQAPISPLREIQN